MSASPRSRLPRQTLTRVLAGCAVLCALTVLAIPDFDCARSPGSRRRIVTANLQSILAAQQQALASWHIDRNGDGMPEYASFRQLAEPEPSRVPALSPAFAKSDDGIVRRGDYLFQLWLPSVDGSFVCADRSGEDSPAIDAERASRTWRCYAWPAPRSGSEPQGPGTWPAFVLDAEGSILTCENWDHEANRSLHFGGRTPSPSAAADATAPDRLAIDRLGTDRQIWKVVR